MADDAQIAVIEAGISEPGQMHSLARMIAPQTVIFTSIGDAHQANFDSIEHKINEKLILADSAEKIVYNSDCQPLADIIEEKFADRTLLDARNSRVEGLTDKISQSNGSLVALFCDIYGFPRPDFAALRPVAMRLEVKPGVDGALIVDDSYSCDIDSLTIALDYLSSVANGRRKVVVLSDILQSSLSDDNYIGLLRRCLRRVV
jgi:alanine racemase